MSATLTLIKKIKEITDNIKSGQQRQKKNKAGHQKLIESLVEMEKVYTQRTAAGKSGIAFEAASGTGKSAEELASAHISALAQRQREEQEAKALKRIEETEEKQKKAFESKVKQESQTYSEFQKRQEQDLSKIITQGLTRSSIAEQMTERTLKEYLAKMGEIRKSYDMEIEALNNQKAIINVEKEKALREFNLSLSAEYENKLAEIKERQLQAAQMLAESEERYRLEEETRKNKRGSLIEYQGEEQEEMRQRYLKALEFYKSMDKKEALKLIERSDELKRLLGLYYAELVEEIGKG